MTNDSQTKITLDEAVAAFAKTGAKPMRFSFRRQSKDGLQCCAVGALVLAKDPTFNPGYRDEGYEGFTSRCERDYGLTESEVARLADGFDCNGPEATPGRGPYYDLGRAIAKAVGL